MRKPLLCLLGIAFAAASITGCQQKDPKPGEVPGYEQGETYLSIWVHSIEDTGRKGRHTKNQWKALMRPITAGILRILSSSREMTAAAATPTRSTHR